MFIKFQGWGVARKRVTQRERERERESRRRKRKRTGVLGKGEVSLFFWERPTESKGRTAEETVLSLLSGPHSRRLEQTTLSMAG
jgi:hypothetical protein